MLSGPDSFVFEQVAQFSTFFDLIKNPDKINALVEKANATLAEMRSVVEAYTTVNEANSYLDKAKKVLEDSAAKVEAANAELDAKTESLMKELATRQTAVSDAQAQLIKDTMNLQEATTQFKGLVEAFNSDKAQFELDKANLAQAALDLTAREAALNEKAAKLKSLLG
jgi:cob(I)alamin adenosyltransferase